MYEWRPNVPSKSNSDSDTRHQKYSGVGGQGSSGALSYGGCDPELLRRAIETVASAGDAIVFGRTADSGALSVRVLADKQVFKWYPDSMDSLQDVLRALAE